MLLANFNRKEHLRHRAVSLRQHGFLVCFYTVYLICVSFSSIKRFHYVEGDGKYSIHRPAVKTGDDNSLVLATDSVPCFHCLSSKVKIYATDNTPSESWPPQSRLLANTSQKLRLARLNTHCSSCCQRWMRCGPRGTSSV